MKSFVAAALILAAGAVLWHKEFGGSATIPEFWIGKFTSVPAWDAETERKVVLEVSGTEVAVNERLGEQRKRRKFKVVKCKADSDSMSAETADENHVRMEMLGPGVFKVRWSEFVYVGQTGNGDTVSDDNGETEGVIVSR